MGTRSLVPRVAIATLLLQVLSGCTPARSGRSGGDDDDAAGTPSWATVRGAEERGFPTTRLSGVAFRYTFNGTRHEQVITTDGDVDCEDVRRYFADGLDTEAYALAFAAYFGLPAWEMTLTLSGGWVDVDDPADMYVYLARREATDAFFVEGFYPEIAEVTISERNETRLAGSAYAEGDWVDDDLEAQGAPLEITVEFDVTRCNPQEYTYDGGEEP